MFPKFLHSNLPKSEGLPVAKMEAFLSTRMDGRGAGWRGCSPGWPGTTASCPLSPLRSFSHLGARTLKATFQDRVTDRGCFMPVSFHVILFTWGSALLTRWDPKPFSARNKQPALSPAGGRASAPWRQTLTPVPSRLCPLLHPLSFWP